MPERRSRKFWLSLLAAAGAGWAAAAPAAPEPPGPPWDAPPPQLWFPVGETVDYDISWGIFTVGKATARAEWLEREGRRLLALTVEGKSNGIVEKLYPVDLFLQTILEPVSFLPLSFEKKSREGRHRAHEITTFDHAAKQGHWRSLLKDKQKDFDIGADTRDLLGLMYWIRKEPVQADEIRTYHVMTDEKMYELILEAGRKEPVTLSGYGKVPCIKMEPKGKFNGMFVRKGRMWVWVSDDPRYTVCRVAASVPVASIKIMLTAVRGPGDDFWTQAANRK